MNVNQNNEVTLILRELNVDEKIRYFADMREKALHDEASALHHAREEDIMQGRTEGIEEGNRQIIEKMRKSEMTDEQIQAILKQ